MSAVEPVPIERVVAVDWSGARDAKGVWLAEVDRGVVTRLEAPGSREHAVARVAAASREGPRLAAGLDFAFSYPAWFLESRGCADAFALWDLVAREGEGWLARPAYPFWTLGTRARGEAGPRAYRETEREAAGARVSPKSVFQVGGPGQVGTMSIRGIPLLRDLRAAGLAVWPFETPGPTQSVVVEIYPRRYYGDAVVKGDAVARRAYLGRYGGRVSDAQRDAAAGSDHAFDALTAALAMWDRRDELATLGTAEGEEALEGRIWGT
ncbi:hypothetical protein tb265_18520 [Gemmatimonadetes bacterium T265]|nr:hypothetical protein tb265_18520 [Gemmatimonadetes bacterium T265]